MCPSLSMDGRVGWRAALDWQPGAITMADELPGRLAYCIVACSCRCAARPMVCTGDRISGCWSERSEACVPWGTAAAATDLLPRRVLIGGWQMGKTIGIVGLGRIGREVAGWCTNFGMEVVGYDPILTDAATRAAGIEPVTLDEVSSAAPLFGGGLGEPAEVLAMSGWREQARVRETVGWQACPGRGSLVWRPRSWRPVFFSLRFRSLGLRSSCPLPSFGVLDTATRSMLSVPVLIYRGVGYRRSLQRWKSSCEGLVGRPDVVRSVLIGRDGSITEGGKPGGGRGGEWERFPFQPWWSSVRSWEYLMEIGDEFGVWGALSCVKARGRRMPRRRLLLFAFLFMRFARHGFTSR